MPVFWVWINRQDEDILKAQQLFPQGTCITRRKEERQNSENSVRNNYYAL